MKKGRGSSEMFWSIVERIRSNGQVVGLEDVLNLFCYQVGENVPVKERLNHWGLGWE